MVAYQAPCPWDSPGKNTGVGCHFLLQCMKVKSESEVAQSCPTLSNPMDCSLPGSFVHGIFQARILERVALPSPVHERKSERDVAQSCPHGLQPPRLLSPWDFSRRENWSGLQLPSPAVPSNSCHFGIIVPYVYYYCLLVYNIIFNESYLLYNWNHYLLQISANVHLANPGYKIQTTNHLSICFDIYYIGDLINKIQV